MFHEIDLAPSPVRTSRTLGLLLLALCLCSSAQAEAQSVSGQGSPPDRDPLEGLPSSRAEEWKALRRQRRQAAHPPRQSGVQKAFLYLEKGGIRAIPSIRYKDFYPKIGHLSPGSGLAPGIRYFKSNIGTARISVESSAAFSFSGYKLADLQIGRFNSIAPDLFLGRAAFGRPFRFGPPEPRQVRSFLYADLRYRYFPQELFYGLGKDSSRSDQTDYRLEDSVYDLVAGYQFNRWLAVAARGGYLKLDVGPGSNQSIPDVETLFDGDSAPGLAAQSDFFHFDSGLYLDYRDAPGNPHAGGVLGLSFARYDDRGGSQFEFNRYSLDARQYLPLGSRQRILALRLQASVQDADRGSRAPFFLQRTLGGSETLRGFREFRFRDSNLLYWSIEYRWEAAPAFETAIFYDSGRVFSEKEGFAFRHLRKSIGAGFRFKTSTKLLVRLDVARSEEATRVHFRFGPSF